MRCAVVVVAGGQATRFGEDKLAADVTGTGGGPSLLQTLVDGVLTLAPRIPLQLPVVVVGPARPGLGSGRVVFTREEPPGAGPAAAVLAGAAAAPAADVIVVLPGDAPFAAAALPRLVDALAQSGADAVVGVDPQGRRQHLVLAVRRAHLPVEDFSGRPARSLVHGLSVREVPLSLEESLDVDEPADLEHVRRAARP